MEIKKIIWCVKNTFSADLKCEYCGNIDLSNYGYNDEHYHVNILPNIKCKKCGKSSNSGAKR